MARQDDNPYAPGFGIVPPVLAGREPEFADLDAALRRARAGAYEQPRLLTGERGMGKTAVLVELHASAREAGVWGVDVEASRSGSIVPALLGGLRAHLLAADRDARVGDVARRALRILRSLTVAHPGVAVTVEFDAERGAADSGDLASDLGDVLVAAGEAARAHDTAALVTVDEIQSLPGTQMGPLFGAFQRVAKRSPDPATGERLPVLAVVAGLPNSRAAMRSGAGTYAERVREHVLGLLPDPAVHEALRIPASERGVAWHADALDVAVDGAGGYPFAVQAVGWHVWAASDRRAPDDPALTAADASDGVAAAHTELAHIYDSRLAEVPDGERRYLDAIAALDEADRRSGTIAAELGGSAEDWGWARARLIDRGLLRPTGHGRVTVALPGLEAHLRDRLA